MTTFVIGYMVVWLAVVAYLGRMGSRQRDLERRVARLSTPHTGPRVQSQRAA